MKRLRNILLAASAACGLAVAAPAHAGSRFQHVLLISVDGLHAVDLQNWLQSHPSGTIAGLARNATIFPNAFTTAPSDSFPGMLAQVTGATSGTTGVYYDDSYDRTLFAPRSNCQGEPGSEVAYAENIDRDQSLVTAGGTLGQPLTQIDPAKLPMQKVGSTCAPLLPHQFLRANTIFEVIKAAGLRTAWSDKHPSYEILNGPSGHGIDDLFTPEINSLIPGQTKDDNTKSFAATRSYDLRKVTAVVNEIKGMDSTGKTQVGVPAIFGMNFQAVSVGQKLAKGGIGDAAGLVGGYLDANATPGNALSEQLAFVENSLGIMVYWLQVNHLRDSTLIIVSAKHGQSPIDRSLRKAVDDEPYNDAPGAAFHIADDVGLVWLKPQTRAANVAAAKSFLLAHADQLGIQLLLDPASLGSYYRDPARDSRTPDFVAVSKHGVIYTGGSKLSEHGGFDFEDRNVALMVSAPRLAHTVNYKLVETKQIAPSILGALGLDATKLDGVRIEGTQALPF